MDLYFANEMRSELPNDVVSLVKLDLLKEGTISKFKQKIKQMKALVNPEGNPRANELLGDFNYVKSNFQQNCKELNHEQIQQEMQIQQIGQISGGDKGSDRRTSRGGQTEPFSGI